MADMTTDVPAATAGLAPPVRLDDYEPRARQLLPRSIYDYFAGGAEDEASLAANRAAYSRYRFRFKVLSSVRPARSRLRDPRRTLHDAGPACAHGDPEDGAHGW